MKDKFRDYVHREHHIYVAIPRSVSIFDMIDFSVCDLLCMLCLVSLRIIAASSSKVQQYQEIVVNPWTGVQESVIKDDVTDHRQRRPYSTCIHPQEDMNVHCDIN